MFRKDYTFTKRHLGILLLTAGILGVAGLLAIDALNIGREGGIGPAQEIGLFVSVLTALIGLSLIPLGNTPA